MGKKPSAEPVAMVNTGINLPKDDLLLLRRVAVSRAHELGGRPSISAVIARLIADNRPALEKEAKGGK